MGLGVCASISAFENHDCKNNVQAKLHFSFFSFPFSPITTIRNFAHVHCAVSFHSAIPSSRHIWSGYFDSRAKIPIFWLRCIFHCHISIKKSISLILYKFNMVIKIEKCTLLGPSHSQPNNPNTLSSTILSKLQMLHYRRCQRVRKMLFWGLPLISIQIKMFRTHSGYEISYHSPTQRSWAYVLMLTIHHMYFYTTQNNSKFGVGSLREHCIIMFQKSLLPFSASAALSEPAGLRMTGQWGADCSFCTPDWQTDVTICPPSLTALAETRTLHCSGTHTSKSFIPHHVHF